MTPPARRWFLNEGPLTDPPPPAKPWRPESLAQGACFGALYVALSILASLCYRIAQGPQLGTDSLIYHLPYPVAWAQEGFGADLALPFHEIGLEHGPLLAPAIHYVLVRLCGGVELAWCVQPLAFLLVLGIFFNSLRLLGLGRSPTAGLTALVAVYFPPFFNDLQLAGSDMLLLAALALTLYGVLLTRASARRGLRVVILGVALQLLSKGTGLMSIVALSPLLLPALRRWWLESPSGRARGLDLGGAALALVLGGWTYVRNLFVFGNPLWPADFGIAGVSVFEGRFDPGPLRDHGWSADALRGLLVEGSGPHGIPLALSLPLWGGFVVGLLLALRTYSSERTQSPGRGYPRLAVTILFPLAAVIVHFLFVPYWDEPRYLFAVYYALCLATGSALALAIRHNRRLSPWISGALPGLFFVLTVLSLHSSGYWFWPALLAAPLGFLPRARRRLLHRGLGVSLALCALLSFAWVPALRASQRERMPRAYARHYPDHGESWSFLAELSPQRIAYAGTQMTLPLRGAELQHTPLYVPVGPKDFPKRFSLEGRPEECTPSWFWIFAASAYARRSELDPEGWLERLESAEVDLIYLADDPWRGGVQAEVDLIASAPERFKLLYSSPKTAIYRFLPKTPK